MSLDLPGWKEADAWEAEVLMVDKHLHWHYIGLTQMVDEATDVSILPGIDTVGLTILGQGMWTITICVYTIFIF